MTFTLVISRKQPKNEFNKNYCTNSSLRCKIYFIDDFLSSCNKKSDIYVL